MARNFVEFAISRVLQAIPVLFGLSIFVFVLSRVIPGAPVRLALGPTASEEEVQEMRREMHLDEPLHVQYINWLSDFLRGDWGTSIATTNNVLVDIMQRLPATFEIVVSALLLAILLSIPFGVIAGTNQNSWQDHVSRITALVGVSMPRFWIAILFQVIFVVSLGIFPLTGRLSNALEPPKNITGLYLVDSLITGNWTVFFDVLSHLALPVIALSLATTATLMRLIRAEMIEESKKDYTLAAKSYGLPRNLIQYKYMLKNSLSSSVTILGLTFGGLMGNAFYVEIVFAYPGVARYGVNAIINQDFNAIVGITILTGVAYTIGNLMADLVYGFLDPRIRMED